MVEQLRQLELDARLLKVVLRDGAVTRADATRAAQRHNLFVFASQDVADETGDGLGNVIDVLRLERRLEVVLENAREVVLQLRAAKVLQNVGPFRFVLASENKRRAKRSNNKRVVIIVVV